MGDEVIDPQPWRCFDATVTGFVPDAGNQVEIGKLHGCITFNPHEELLDSADAMSYELAVLAAAAERVLAKGDVLVDAVLLLELIRLDGPYRGQSLAWGCVESVLQLLDSRQALVVLQPEPQREEGGPYEGDALRDPALSRLRSAWAAYGFSPSDDGLTMWRFFGEA